MVGSTVGASPFARELKPVMRLLIVGSEAKARVIAERRESANFISGRSEEVYAVVENHLYDFAITHASVVTPHPKYYSPLFGAMGRLTVGKRRFGQVKCVTSEQVNRNISQVSDGLASAASSRPEDFVHGTEWFVFWCGVHSTGPQLEIDVTSAG